MQKIISPEHYFLNINTDIRKICEPLKKHFGITSFVYGAVFPDGSDIKLGTNPEWLEFFYNQHLYQHSQVENKPSLYKDGFVLWSELTDHQIILQHARDDFNIDHGISYIKATAEQSELFFFGTTRDNHQIIHQYINNLDLLKKFASYFTKIASPIIDEAKKHRIYIPNRFSTIKATPKIISDIGFKDTFLDTIQFHGINISRREQQVCQKLIQGKTAKTIAEELFVSPRTIETHLAHVKNKLHCRTKSELVKRLLQFDF